MRNLVFCLALVAVSVRPAPAQLRADTGPDTTPAIGAPAPDFALPRTAGAERLSGLVGEKRVLLMFFPGAFTPGCTREFTEAGIHYQDFVDMNIEILGISRDLPGAQGAFRESVGARNEFVSDPDMTVIDAYGAASARGFANRFYFLIDEGGKIVWKSTTNTLIPTEELLNELSSL